MYFPKGILKSRGFPASLLRSNVSGQLKENLHIRERRKEGSLHLYSSSFFGSMATFYRPTPFSGERQGSKVSKGFTLVEFHHCWKQSSPSWTVDINFYITLQYMTRRENQALRPNQQHGHADRSTS
jgi:hypothetical protein